MELALQSASDAESRMIDVAEVVFGAPYKPDLVHQTVNAYLAAARSGSKAQKTRSQVSGSTAKPWRQKGTGRARAGNRRSPIWRGGGATFAAVPRDYTQKLNKKMYRSALRSILSELVRQERLVVLESLQISEPKTKLFLDQVQAHKTNRLLIIVDELGKNLGLAARNLHWVEILEAKEVNPVSLVGAGKVLATLPAIKQLEERFA